MAEQRQAFRFRLPWLSAIAAPPRPSEPPVQVPPQPTTTSTPQQPPFRPAGIAPSRPPPPAPRTEPQPPPKPEPQPLPSRAATESRVASQPASPARATTQVRATSVPPSPSRTASQIQSTTEAAPQPQSLDRLATRTTDQTSQPSLPLRKAPELQPSPWEVFQPLSPPKKSEPAPQQTSQPPLSLIQPPSFVPHEQEPKPFRSMRPLQEQPKTELESAIVSESPYQTATPFKREKVTTQAAQISVGVAAVAPTSVAEEKKAVGESVKEGKPEDGKKDAVHQVKEEETKETIDEQMRKALTKLLTGASGSGTQIRALLTSTFQTGERKREEQESFDRKKPLSTSDSDEEQIKTVSSTHLKDSSTRGDIQRKTPLHKEIKDNILQFTQKLTLLNSKQMDGKPVSMITLAGENRGASMLIGSESTQKDGSVHIYRGYRINSNEIHESTTDGEGSSKERIPGDPIVRKDQERKVYVNSNMQSTNNSILLESSVNERNPGVQLDISHNQKEDTKSAIQLESIETHKAEFSITPAQNLTYQPTIRREYLRGLSMEPSDSDPDNPEKPQSHACLYNCGEKGKDKEIVLN
ncbi:proteoglycan 4-like [Mangifera indica]|uniref:proteoglycan 4-like n=1 Tax=Mangifera indica TaxID=29780 RepID=UPI001CFAE594|nr:proteoglycan 4-like [Mangifera indica]